MSIRLLVQLVMPVIVGGSTALALLSAEVAPAMCAICAWVATLWLLLVLSRPERGDA